MTKLELIAIDDDKPLKLTVTLPAALHHNYVALQRFSRRTRKPIEAAKLIASMLEKFLRARICHIA